MPIIGPQNFSHPSNPMITWLQSGYLVTGPHLWLIVVLHDHLIIICNLFCLLLQKVSWEVDREGCRFSPPVHSFAILCAHVSHLYIIPDLCHTSCAPPHILLELCHLLTPCKTCCEDVSYWILDGTLPHLIL